MPLECGNILEEIKLVISLKGMLVARALRFVRHIILAGGMEKILF